jgi:methylated-DNA-[protein]-cysteine S-methyltransferase
MMNLLGLTEGMTMQTYSLTESPIGDLTLVNTDGALSGLYMRDGRAPKGSALGERTSAGFEQTSEELTEYFGGARREFDVATAAHGDAFQHRVWALLRQIPYGKTRSYGDLARDLGDPGLARAVGLANARNPISIIVPCHRVVGSDGSLTGYGGGLERKRYLLDLEAPATNRFATLFQA